MKTKTYLSIKLREKIVRVIFPLERIFIIRINLLSILKLRSLELPRRKKNQNLEKLLLKKKGWFFVKLRKELRASRNN